MPIMQMDLLRTFATVADLGSFTKAGDALGRTQPAISLQIKRLEELLQAPLIERDSRHLRLTTAGETLASYAQQILKLHDEALARLGAPTVTGTVRVGIPNDFAVSFLPRVLSDFMALEPGITVEVHCEISVTLLRELQDGKLDLAIAMSAEPAGPAAARVWTERLAWVAGGPGHGAGGHAAAACGLPRGLHLPGPDDPGPAQGRYPLADRLHLAKPRRDSSRGVRRHRPHRPVAAHHPARTP